jgi:DNA-binding LytR/AlgR family response regulator
MTEPTKPHFTILVAEDEDQMRERLIAQLTQCCPQGQIVAVAENGNDAWDLWLEHEPDVVFLDIQMPGLSGLAVAERIRGRSQIVFVTAYDQHAVQAFEHSALDYLLKPVTLERLSQTTNRLVERLNSLPVDSEKSAGSDQAKRQATALTAIAEVNAKEKKSATKWLRASVGKQIRLIHLNDILFLQSDTKYTRVVTKEGEAYIRTPLKDLVEMLDTEIFWQIHRGTIVNAHAIEAAERIDSERLLVSLKDCAEKLAVSRSFAYLFRESQ